MFEDMFTHEKEIIKFEKKSQSTIFQSERFIPVYTLKRANNTIRNCLQNLIINIIVLNYQKSEFFSGENYWILFPNIVVTLNKKLNSCSYITECIKYPRIRRMSRHKFSARLTLILKHKQKPSAMSGRDYPILWVSRRGGTNFTRQSEILSSRFPKVYVDVAVARMPRSFCASI